MDEFKAAMEPLVAQDDEVWVHFEGRVPEVLFPCVVWLRQRYGFHKKVMVSVECEKPDRVGLVDVAAMADVVFYSRIWAEVSDCWPSRLLHFDPRLEISGPFFWTRVKSLTSKYR